MDRSYYLRNKPRFADRNRVRYTARAQYVYDYLVEHSCLDCAETDPVVLDFDHLRDKEHDISWLIRYGTLARIRREIAKCEVVCANCHRRRTARRGNHFRWAASASST
jgi:hypothetical protein